MGLGINYVIFANDNHQVSLIKSLTMDPRFVLTDKDFLL